MIGFRLHVAQLTEYDDNGFIGVQFDGFGERGAPMVELLHPYGFASRPLDPQTAEGETVHAANLLIGWEGDDAFAFLLNDPRVQVKVPQLEKGGSVQYASDGSFAVFNPRNNTWTLYQPYEFDDDGTPTKAHVVTVGRDGNGTPIVELSNGEGTSVTLLGSTAVISSGDGSAYVEVSNSGVNVVGPFKAAGGADIGGPGSMPLTKFAPLSSYLNLVQAALSAIVAIPANSGASGAVAAAQAALATFSSTGATITTKGA